MTHPGSPSDARSAARAASTSLTLEWLPGRFAVCRLDPAHPVPGWACGVAAGAPLLCVTRTERELSIVVHEELVPAGLDVSAPVQRGFAALRVVGTLNFALVGVLARLTAALAAANVSVFVVSTYDTDVLLVREHEREPAAQALGTIATFAARTAMEARG